MNSPVRVVTATALLLTVFTPGVAAAEPVTDSPVVEPAPPTEVLHNVTYRTRVDGVSRGATVTWTAQDNRIQTENPTMVPGRIFETQTVLPASGTANVRLSIQWPYSANLHCEILIDDQLVAQADDFVAPRVLPQRDDPDFGSLTCEAPVGGVPAPPVEPPPPAPPA